MTDCTTQTQGRHESVGASRRSNRIRPSIAWSNAAMAAVAAPKPYAVLVANKAFGGHDTTLHPRPEEAPL